MRPFALKLPAAAAALVLAVSAAGAGELSHKVVATQAVDLSHEMYEGMAYWPGGVPFKMERLVDYPQGYLLHKFEVGENTGTHVDAPHHFVEENLSVADLPLNDLIVPAVMIDVTDKVAENVDYQLTAADVE
ncbi:MAG: cyclase family protein, partial [Kiloniellales bacterium]|nr:cyclase family protein [Kiloniellales bacterium]